MNIAVEKSMDEFIKNKINSGEPKSAIEFLPLDIAHIMGNKEIIKLLQNNAAIDNDTSSKNITYLDKCSFFATVANEHQQTASSISQTFTYVQTN